MKIRLIGIICLLMANVCLSGCGTLKGMGSGVATAVGATAQGTTEDAKALWKGIVKADNWMKGHLW